MKSRYWGSDWVAGLLITIVIMLMSNLSAMRLKHPMMRIFRLNFSKVMIFQASANTEIYSI